MTEAMKDQASVLREMVKASGRRARVIAVTGGKGGVGKTILPVNLAMACAQLGKRSLVIDADLGLANTDIVLDVASASNLSHVVKGTREMQDVVVKTKWGIDLIPGASGLGEMAALPKSDLLRLAEGFRTLEASQDLIFFDTGAGIGPGVLTFALAAHQMILVTTAEPTAVTDAYATLKLLLQQGFRGKCSLVVNMAGSLAEAAQCARGVGKVATQFLKFKVDWLGYLLRDPVVSLAVKRRQPFLSLFPKSCAAEGVRMLASRLLAGRTEDDDGTAPGFIHRLVKVLGG